MLTLLSRCLRPIGGGIAPMASRILGLNSFSVTPFSVDVGLSKWPQSLGMESLGPVSSFRFRFLHTIERPLDQSRIKTSAFVPAWPLLSAPAFTPASVPAAACAWIRARQMSMLPSDHHNLVSVFCHAMILPFPILFFWNPIWLECIGYVIFVVHVHWAFESIAIDYLCRTMILNKPRSPVVGKVAVAIVYIFSIFLLASLIHFRMTDVGLINAIKMLWTLDGSPATVRDCCKFGVVYERDVGGSRKSESGKSSSADSRGAGDAGDTVNASRSTLPTETKCESGVPPGTYAETDLRRTPGKIDLQKK